MKHYRILGRLGLSIAALALSASALAQSASSGSGSSSGGKGFDCGPGMTYQVVNGIARCTQPAPSGSPPEAACPTYTYSSGSCQYDIRSSSSRSTTVTANKTPGYSGQVTATCSAGTWGGFAATCGGNPCTATTVTSGSCSYNLPAASSGNSVTGANTVAGFTGSMTAACSAGSFSVLSSTCNAVPRNCAAGVASWGSCTGNVAATVDGGTATSTNVTAGFTGTADFACSNGSWVGPYSPVCNANPVCPPAPATTQSTACPPGYTGSQTETRTATCNAGTGYSWVLGAWAVTSTTCTPVTPPLFACPATITIGYTNAGEDHSTVAALEVANPTDRLPNGNQYCRYRASPGGDRAVGVFDRVVGKAVDFYPLYKETLRPTQNKTADYWPFVPGKVNCPYNRFCWFENGAAVGLPGMNYVAGSFTFAGYEAVYSGSDNQIQGASCANNQGDPYQLSGFYPGTCYEEGAGRFARIVMFQADPASTFGKILSTNGITSLRYTAGGDKKWGKKPQTGEGVLKMRAPRPMVDGSVPEIMMRLLLSGGSVPLSSAYSNTGATFYTKPLRTMDSSLRGDKLWVGGEDVYIGDLRECSQTYNSTLPADRICEGVPAE